jgi:ABC-type sugar transport system substrate-binding protein
VIATNANGAAAQQTTDIENLIEQNCDVIIIANGEAEALINVVARAKERGIYVISYESGWIEGCDTTLLLLPNFI